MSSTSQSLLSTLGGKDSFGTGSHIFAAIFAATTFTLHVVQSYLFTPVANVKHIPLPSPAPLPSPVTPTTTRPLTPTRSSDFVESRADISYILFSLILVLIVILAGAGSIFIRTKKSNSTITRNARPRDQEQEQDPPPNIPPQHDKGSPDDAEDREEHEDGAGDPDDKAEDEGSDEQDNDDNSTHVGGGSPGGEPDDPSGSSNVDNIPPPHFEPDPWDVLALAFLYIFLVTNIIRYVLHKYLELKIAAQRLCISAISIMPHAFHKYLVLKTTAKRLLTSAISIMRHVLHEHFVLDTAAKRLFTAAVSIRTKASECFDHALQHVDARFSWIENVGVLMAMDIVDTRFSRIEEVGISMAVDILDVGIWNSTRGIENVTVSDSVASEVIMLDELHEANTKPTLIEGLLVPISFHLPRIPASVSLEVLEHPEPIIQLPLLPPPTLEAVELPSLSLPALEAVELPSLPLPALDAMEIPSLPLPTLEATIPAPEPPVVQHETSSAETEDAILGVTPALEAVELPSLPLPTLEVVELPSLPLPTLEAVELRPLPLPTLEVVELRSLPLPTLEAVELRPLPLSTLEAVIPPPEPRVIQHKTSSAETADEFLGAISTMSGYGALVFGLRQIVKGWIRRRRRTVQVEKHEPEVEVGFEEEEEEDEDYSSTAVGEQSSNGVTSDYLDAHGFEEVEEYEEEYEEEEDDGTTAAGEQSSSGYLDAHGFEEEYNEEEGMEAHQHSDILDNSFATAQEISVTIDPAEPIQEARPVIPTITVSPSFDVPNTPERAITYPSGTPSFVDVITSSTLRHEGTQRRPVMSPAIMMLLSTADTPEPTTTYPSGTPSFADVLTSSVLRPGRKHKMKLRPKRRPAPFFSPLQDTTNAPSFADVATPFAFSVEYPRQRDTNTDADTASTISSATPGPVLRSPASREISLSLGPVLFSKRRRLDGADQSAIHPATPSFDGVTTSSPAVGHNRRRLGDIGTPTRNTRIRIRARTSASKHTPGSMPSLSEGRRGDATYDEPESGSESETRTEGDNVFDTSLSFTGVISSPAVQHSNRWRVEETEETSLVDRDSFSHLVSDPTDEEAFDPTRYTQYEAGAGVEEQSYADLSGSEKSMEIEDEDHSNIYDLDTEPFELTPRPTPAFLGTKNVVSEGEQAILDQATPEHTSPAPADNSFVSEGNQTVLDPEIIAQGAAQMLRLLQEDMEREKVAKEEAAREMKRAGKMKMRESQESSAVRGEVVDGTRRKYISTLEALKHDAPGEGRLERTGKVVHNEAGSSSLSKHKPGEANWQFSREKMIQEVARMRDIVTAVYASENYDDDEIDRLTLLNLGVGDMEGDRQALL